MNSVIARAVDADSDVVTAERSARPPTPTVLILCGLRSVRPTITGPHIERRPRVRGNRIENHLVIVDVVVPSAAWTGGRHASMVAIATTSDDGLRDSDRVSIGITFTRRPEDRDAVVLYFE